MDKNAGNPTQEAPKKARKIVLLDPRKMENKESRVFCMKLVEASAAKLVGPGNQLVAKTLQTMKWRQFRDDVRKNKRAKLDKARKLRRNERKAERELKNEGKKKMKSLAAEKRKCKANEERKLKVLSMRRAFEDAQ